MWNVWCMSWNECFQFFFISKVQHFLTSKRLEWGQFLIFPKMYFQKRGWNPEFFVTFNLRRCQLKLHISWKRHWNSSNRSENMKTFSANISYFRQFVSFHQFFGFFDITCCKETNQLIKDNVSIFFHFQLTLNRLFSNRIRLYQY